MKNLCNIILVLLISASSLSAQSFKAVVEEIVKHASESCVTVTYTFKASIDGVKLEDSGYVEAQDGLWHMKGESLEIYTDAEATWIISHDSMEAIAEPAWSYDDLAQFYDSAKAVGKDMTIQVVSKKTGEKKPVSSFSPPAFGPDWVVSDLR